MASIYQLKPAFQNLLRPLTRALAAAHGALAALAVAAALAEAGLDAKAILEKGGIAPVTERLRQGDRIKIGEVEIEFRWS